MKSLSAPVLNIRRSLFFRTELDLLLTSSMCFSCIMVFIRLCHTGRHTFIFMIWNLFLAYIPYALSTWLTARYATRHSDETSPTTSLPPGARRRGVGGDLSANAPTKALLPVVGIERLLLYSLSFVWLLFIPNAFYILTDLFHLADGNRNIHVPQWFDLALILSCAWNGLLLGALSLRQMEKLFIPRATALQGWLFVCPIMFLNALGIYAGRYLRYNSWDILSNPLQLLSDITDMIIHPFRNHYAWNMIFCFTILLTLIYRMLRGGSKALA